jgi:hypothetical protein
MFCPESRQLESPHQRHAGGGGNCQQLVLVCYYIGRVQEDGVGM